MSIVAAQIFQKKKAAILEREREKMMIAARPCHLQSCNPPIRPPLSLSYITHPWLTIIGREARPLQCIYNTILYIYI